MQLVCHLYIHTFARKNGKNENNENKWEYVFAPMDQEILKVFFYNVRYAVVMHSSAWSAVY